MSTARSEESSLAVPLLKVTATIMLLLGFVNLLMLLPEIANQLFAFRADEHKAPLAERFSTTFSLLGGPLRFAALGGMALAAAQITFGLPKRRAAFNFLAKFGEYLQTETSEQFWRRHLIGVLCLVGGPVLSLVGNATSRGAARLEGPAMLLAFVIGPMIVFIGMLVFLTALRQLAPRAEKTLHRTRLRPILYLRSFGSDARTFDRGIGQYFRLMLLGPWGHQTVEHALALAVKDFRPLVAIGQPGEHLPPLGASRLYVSHDWQQVVARLVETCPLVILRIGNTPGFWWEIEHLVEKCDPSKVLIYLPKHDRGLLYQTWRTRASEYLPVPLPPMPGNAMFLGFGPGWEPRLYGTGASSLGTMLRRPLGGRTPKVREAINEAFRQLGARPTKLPIMWREIVLSIVLILFLFSTVAITLAN